jgi:ComF family protein
MLHELLHLLYPNLCMVCNGSLPKTGQGICVRCQYKMPKTNYHETPDNPITRRFWGRIDLQFGAAMLYYNKESGVRKLIHSLKYENKPQIGVEIGKLYGKILRENIYFQQIDAIVDVPMHPIKERKRGYNQATMFAEGLAQTMQKPLIVAALERYEDTESQTQKDKMDRMGVIENLYGVARTSELAGKHILLVDDVFTTGATLEGCAAAILMLPDTKISVATIATGQK